MKVNNRSASFRARGPFASALACLLLAGIVYSVSLGTVHSHGSVSQEPIADISASFAELQRASFEVPPLGGTEADNCLICVLHRQLFSSTVSTPHFNVTSSEEIALVPTAAVSYHFDPIISSPIARSSGRAPPAYRG